MSAHASTSRDVTPGSQEWSVVLRAQDGSKLVLYNPVERQFNLASTSPASTRALPPTRASLPLSGSEEHLELIPSSSDRAIASIQRNDSNDYFSAASSSSMPPSSFPRRASATRGSSVNRCPLCGSSLEGDASRRDTHRTSQHAQSASPSNATTSAFRRSVAPKKSLPPDENSYFALLSDSRMGTPTQSGRDGPEPLPDDPRLSEATMNTGYFETFFRTIEKLGQGSNGSVYLVQHVLNNEPLGLYACKKVAVGDSSPALLSILREVHLLETLQDPHVISYHHAWIEVTPPTAFAPAVPTLFILMSYANGGSLEDFVRSRRPEAIDPAEEGLSRAERIRYMKTKKMGAVHLLRVDEILTLFEDVTEGLAFLHSRNILHLDLKAANVLLQWEEDALLPTAKLCDFGSSDASLAAWSRARTGVSGTLEYSAPESWARDPRTGKLLPATRARDMWALGLILHLLCFFTLPWTNQRDIPALEQEIRDYPGFLASEAYTSDKATRHDLPLDLLTLIAELVHRDPSKRPRCETVLKRIEQIREKLIEGGEIPVPFATLVKQPSPPLYQRHGGPALDHHRPSLQLMRQTTPPALAPPHRHPTSSILRRFPNGTWAIRIGAVQLVLPQRTRRQVAVVLASLARVWLIDRVCSHPADPLRVISSSSMLSTTLLLLLAFVEFVALDLRLTFATTLACLAVALTRSGSTQANKLCRHAFLPSNSSM